MDLRQLRHFVAAVDHGGVGRAAAALGVSQQALSKSIERLETRLGTRLLTRSARGVVPTPPGRAILDQARLLVIEAQRLERAAAMARELDAGQHVIALSPVAAAGWVGAAVAAFVAARPRLGLVVEGGLDRQLVPALLAGGVDLVVATETMRPPEGVAVTPLGSEGWCVAGRPGHPLLSIASGFEALAGARWLVGRHNALLYDQVRRLLDRRAGPAATPVLTGSLEFALQALRSSDLLAILPESLVAGAGLETRHFPETGWRSTLGLMQRAGDRLPPVLEALAAALASGAAARAAAGPDAAPAEGDRP